MQKHPVYLQLVLFVRRSEHFFQVKTWVLTNIFLSDETPAIGAKIKSMTCVKIVYANFSQQAAKIDFHLQMI